MDLKFTSADFLGASDHHQTDSRPIQDESQTNNQHLQVGRGGQMVAFGSPWAETSSCLVIHCINLLTIIRPTLPNHNVETGKSLVGFGGLMAALGPKDLVADAQMTEKVRLMITPSKLLLYFFFYKRLPSHRSRACTRIT